MLDDKARGFMKLTLDATTGVPLTEQIVNAVRAWIGSREARPGGPQAGGRPRGGGPRRRPH
ncbi:hypothetical protein [Cupriavidus plantarum]|uniref:hypothetical protein n=1 Tax=Cupriavidus plantarum TaxID=942865 RepID=UPI00339D646A